MPEKVDQKFLQNLKNEIKILSIIDGPFLAKAYFSFLEGCLLCIVMEYMVGGDMRKVLDEWAYLDPYSARYYAGQLILGV